MWNVLLDDYPEEWKGYPINSDFRTGILITQALSDESMNFREQFCVAAELLFGEEYPDSEEAAGAIKWFLSEYHHDNNRDEKSDDIIMDFDIDQWRIYAAFRQQYGIDLNKAEMHWFEFMGLMTNLNECAFVNVMDIRQKKITSKMSAEEKAAIKKAKKTFEIKPPKEIKLEPEEQKRVDDFMKYANIKRK